MCSSLKFGLGMGRLRILTTQVGRPDISPYIDLFNTYKQDKHFAIIVLVDVLLDRDVFACHPTGYGSHFVNPFCLGHLMRDDNLVMYPHPNVHNDDYNIMYVMILLRTFGSGYETMNKKCLVLSPLSVTLVWFLVRQLLLHCITL